MGAAYYIVNKEEKIFYELGKGQWSLLANNLDAFADFEYLCLFLLDEVFESTKRQCSKEMIDYIEQRVARDIFRLFGKVKPENLVVINDLTDDLAFLKMKKYECVGTRFFDKESTEYVEYLNKLNEHLYRDYFILSNKDLVLTTEW